MSGKLSTSMADAARAARLKSGLSVAELSERSGVCIVVIHTIENGKKTTPYLSTVIALAHALGVTVDEYTGHGAPGGQPREGTASGEDMGRSMRAARLREGLTIAQLAERTGVMPSTIRHMETGKRNCILRSAELCADALGLSLEEYTGGAA